LARCDCCDLRFPVRFVCGSRELPSVGPWRIESDSNAFSAVSCRWRCFSSLRIGTARWPAVRGRLARSVAAPGSMDHGRFLSPTGGAGLGWLRPADRVARLLPDRASLRRAITEDSRVKPDYARIRVPVLAIYRRDPPFEDWAADFAPRNEQERGALRQQYAATRAMVTSWQRDLLDGVPTARIVQLPGANLYMFLSDEADVLWEVRAFATTLTDR